MSVGTECFCVCGEPDRKCWKRRLSRLDGEGVCSTPVWVMT